MPPHIQGAERRTERRAQTTGSRWGLRVLVVGGLAGAAWLLTGAAAHAADRSDGPVGSLLGSVVDGDVTAPVSGLLSSATRPLEAAVPVKHSKKHVVADILEVPQRVLTRPAKTVVDVATAATVDTAKTGVDVVTREVVEPTRLTGEPAADPHRLTAVTDDVTPDADPVAERPQEPAVAPEPVAAAPAPAVTAGHARIVKALPAPVAAVKHGVPARHSKTASASIAHRHPVMHRAVAGTAAVTEDSPGGDGPAPLQVHLGDVSGTPTSSWSGSPTEGGSPAFLPAAIASSTMACQRLPIASDVEVRRIDAEAPTVSPD
ncbi:hypothetical protein [Paractinoplanes rishiriensis]|uniref:hypothetical protein n=1 Tax=Paractinoplanes rishiriensis TaxID=1050105 RepID=UPI0019403D89|nr:hypothetical protein [Actinoplanes rishiriensis]